MITSDFTGNFGNHIFQYAALRSIAEKKGYDWGFTKYIYGDYFGGQPQMDFLDLDYGKQPVDGIIHQYDETIVRIRHIDEVAIHQYDSFENLQDNSKLFGCWQSEQYFEKEKVKEWFKIKNIENYINLRTDEETCVINVRGGVEYRSCPSTLLLPLSYWNNAVAQMRNINPQMKFIVITDDVPYAQSLFPNFPCYHTGINTDYFVINQANYLIISNSSFAWFPAYLNERAQMIIAPKYWARYNVSDGYWASSNIFTKGWMYINREGRIQSYDEVFKELRNSRYAEFYNLGIKYGSL